MSELVFSCPATKRSFNSGFHGTDADLKLIPTGKTLRLRCSICGELHECDFAAATICRSPNFCRERKDCQLCRFAVCFV